MSQQFGGLKVDNQLMFRVMKKGREDNWGKDESKSMAIFYSEGLKLREMDPIFGVPGKFRTQTGDSDGELKAWLQQHPIEVLNAPTYGQDIIWSDATHNATKYSFKTGPIGSVDWGLGWTHRSCRFAPSTRGRS